MRKKSINYEDRFMCVIKEKPKTYIRSFNQDYRLRTLVDFVRLTKGNMLDIGCGGGISTESFPYYFPKMKIYGCDVSNNAITYAKKYGSGKIEYSQIKRKRLPYRSNSFDLCACNDVLEHVPDVNSLLNEARRVLKPGGKFFLTIPCEGQPLTIFWFFTKIHFGQNLTYRNFGHIHPEFTHKNVIKLLEDHGFAVNKVGYAEHLFSQILHLFIFHIPKCLIELIVGEKKIMEYSESGLLTSPKTNSDPLLILQKLWFTVINFILMYPIYWETIIFNKLPFSAWKLQVLVSKDKKIGLAQNGIY